MPRKALLLVGSPRTARSTSMVLGACLLACLRRSGWRTSERMIYRELSSSQRLLDLVRLIDEVDLVVLSFPLYFDTLPFGVIRLFEAVQAHRKEWTGATVENPFPALAVVCNSGFPEADQSALALAVCRQFALSAHFVWRGGLAFGGGEGIKGRPLQWFWPLTRGAMRALRLAGAALAREQVVPVKAIDLMSSAWLPARLYAVVARLRWWRLARRHHAVMHLDAQPYGKTDAHDGI